MTVCGNSAGKHHRRALGCRGRCDARHAAAYSGDTAAGGIGVSLIERRFAGGQRGN